MFLIRFIDRLTEPENPFTLRFLLACATFFYVGGFVWDPAWFSAAVGMMFLAWPLSEERARFKRDRRLAEWRAAMNEIERRYREAIREARLRERMQRIYGPIADCEGMGI